MKKYFLKIHQNPLKWSGSKEQHFLREEKNKGVVWTILLLLRTRSHIIQARTGLANKGCQCGEST
jgi:hypothetical protein